jgi:iron complex outermembrane receptor protein
VQSRQNYAQDLQISIRGFGARSSFGVRGVRLYSDNIPGTMPDGQGQFSQFDLGSTDHIEVLRGPFSALYGNSSGGVIAVFTADAPPGRMLEAGADYGTFGTTRYSLKAGGGDPGFNYVLDAAHFQTDGYRDHSAAERNNFNAKLRLDLDEASTLTLIANAVETPFVQDPLGLTRAQLNADPTQAGVGALSFDTRKSLAQEQTAVTYARRLSDTDDFQETLYAGHRATVQYQAIPVATEKSASSPGGVIDLDRTFWGSDSHLADHRDIGGTQLKTTLGVSYDDLQEERQSYLNYAGTVDGVEGALRIAEGNHVYDVDEYLQAQWDPGARWRLIGGVRNSTVDVASHDQLAGGDSGVRFSAVDPVAGVTFKAAPAVNLYAAYGKGFETPTLNDLAYRSTDGSIPGLNLTLVPARSNNYEAGIKAAGAGVRMALDAFYTKTVDELGVLASSSGRSVYHNIPQTLRRGAELGVEADAAYGFSGRLAYTYLHAVVGEGYQTCPTSPCKPATAKPVAAGNYLPAVPMNSLYAGITWRHAPTGFAATLEAQARAQIFADDRNTAAAASYWVENLRFGWVQEHRGWRFSEFARVDNLADRAYVGSVIVNDNNSRFFEPEPGRTFGILFTAAHRSAAD